MDANNALEVARQCGADYEDLCHDGSRFVCHMTGEQLVEFAARIAGQAWLPIKTAPKGANRLILGAVADDEDRPAITTVGWWDDGYPDGPDVQGHDAGWIDIDGWFMPPRSFGAEAYQSAGIQPTHYMQLPPPPIAPAAEPCPVDGKSCEIHDHCSKHGRCASGVERPKTCAAQTEGGTQAVQGERE